MQYGLSVKWHNSCDRQTDRQTDRQGLFCSLLFLRPHGKGKRTMPRETASPRAGKHKTRNRTKFLSKRRKRT